MDRLPETIQDIINLNIHEIKFADTLNVVKHLFDDDVELTPFEDDTNTITPTDMTISDVESEFSSEMSFNHASDIEMERDIFV